MPVPITPRMVVWPGSASNTATATPTGSASASARNDVATVPKMAGRAPNGPSSEAGSHEVEVRNPSPKCAIEGRAWTASVMTISTSTAGTSVATPATVVRQRSGGLAVITRAWTVSAVVATLRPFALAVQPVAHTPHRHDVERRDARELLAQPPNVHVDRLAVAREVRTPHVLEQDVAGVHARWVCKQVG